MSRHKRYLAQTSQKNTYKGMKDTLHDFENKPYILVSVSYTHLTLPTNREV